MCYYNCFSSSVDVEQIDLLTNMSPQDELPEIVTQQYDLGWLGPLTSRSIPLVFAGADGW